MHASEQLHPQPASAALPSTAGSFARRAVVVLGTTAVMAVAAHIALPLPFTPVPLTLQTLVVLTAGLLLGPSTAFAAMLLYLLEGACGLPVFSPAGPGGLAQLLGPTAGYLFSYPLAAALAGLLRGRSHHQVFARTLPAAGAAALLILAAGAGWLAVLSHASLQSTLAAAVLPFLPGEVLKVFAAAGFAAGASRLRR